MREAGFTLIEVLVAVAVLALALGVFVSGGSQYADDARYLQDKTMALWVARNKLVEYESADSPPDKGRSDGHAQMGDREWEWHTHVSETPDPRLRKIEVQVFRLKPDSQEVAEKNPMARLVGYVAIKGGGAGNGDFSRDDLPDQLSDQSP